MIVPRGTPARARGGARPAGGARSSRAGGSRSCAARPGVGKTSLVRRFCDAQPRRPRPLGRVRPALHAAPARPVPRHRAARPAASSSSSRRAEPQPVRARRRADARAGAAAGAGRRGRGRCTGRTRRRSTSCGSSRGGSRRCRRSSSPPTATTSSTAATRSGRLLGELTRGDRAARIAVEPLSPDAVAALAARARRRRRRPLPQDERQPVLRHGGARSPRSRASRDRCATPCSRVRPGSGRRRELSRGGRRRPRRTPSSGCSRRSSRARPTCSTSASPPGCCVDDGERVVFRHELARLAIEGSLPATRAPRAARRALAALAEPPGGRARRRAARPPRGRRGRRRRGAARTRRLAAARAASVGAHREAAAHYARALALRRRRSRRRERAELLERRAYSCYLTDQNAEALEALREARRDPPRARRRAGGGERARPRSPTTSGARAGSPSRARPDERVGRAARAARAEPRARARVRQPRVPRRGRRPTATAALHWAQRARSSSAERYDDEPRPRRRARRARRRREVLSGIDGAEERFATTLALATRARPSRDARLAGLDDRPATGCACASYDGLVAVRRGGGRVLGRARARALPAVRPRVPGARRARAGALAAGGRPRRGGAAAPPRVDDADDHGARGDRAAAGPPRRSRTRGRCSTRPGSSRC